MKNIKKYFLMLVIIIAFLAIGTITSNADSELYLNNLEFEAVLNSDGSMDVTEIWNIYIEETNTLYKTFKIDNTRYTKISNFKVANITKGEEISLEQINKEMYHVTEGCYYGLINSNGMYEVAWNVGLDNSSADRIYKIQYTVEDAIAKNNDYAELYWQFVGEDFEISAKQIHGKIILPQKAESMEDIKVWGHTEDLNGTINATSLQEIEFNIKNFRKGRFVEIRTLFPSYMVINSNRGENINVLDSVIKEETIWANEANERREIKKARENRICAVAIIIILIIALFIVKNIIKNIKQIRKTTKLKPTQELEYYREIPRKDATPAEALKLINEQTYKTIEVNHLGSIFSATVLSLCLKKIIEIQAQIGEKDKNKIIIKILQEPVENSIKPDEREVYYLIKLACGGNKEVTLKKLEKYIENNPLKILRFQADIENSIEKQLIQMNYKDEEQYKKYNAIMGAPIIFLIILIIAFIMLLTSGAEINIYIGATMVVAAILNIISIVVGEILKSKINVFTQEAIDEIEKWKALKKYMKDFSLLKEREIPELVLWEEFLVYATAFGISKEVLKQIKLAYPNIENDINMSNYVVMNLMVNNNFSDSFAKNISNSMSSAYSSGTGGGGGFSGGGGGGRWPEVAVAVDNTTKKNALI